VTVSVTGEPPNTAVEEKEETAKEAVKEISPEIMKPLPILDVLRISAVLEDTIDQLSILNYIMPFQYEKRQNISMKNNKEMHSEGRSSGKVPLVSEPSKISSSLVHKEEPKLPEIRQGGQFNKVQDLIFKKPTRQTIMNTETLKKIQIDRQFFSDVITETMEELQEEGTFTNLLKALGKERESKMHFYDIIAREENGRKKIKSLQKQLLNVKKERQAEVQVRIIWTTPKVTELITANQSFKYFDYLMQKANSLEKNPVAKKDSGQEVKGATEDEMVGWHYQLDGHEFEQIQEIVKDREAWCAIKLEEKLEFWMEKFDKDTEMKQNELNALKSAKASDLAHLQELAKTIREYEQVIIEDRIEKEKTRKKREQDDLELRSIIKLQAWWRGTVVRREIGGFKMPKDKDDSKDGKGKGKEKNKRRGKK
ncbi:hypothetical protein G4228_012753, partial [Cervus hanglu yarkandensis]